MHEINLTMMTDFYQLTMMQGYFASGEHKKKSVFDMFFRKSPEQSAYAISCGLDLLIKYVESIRFSEDDIGFLENEGSFTPEFLDYLRGFRFSGDIHAVPEGTVVFPHEPILRVTAPIIEAQFLETALLNIMNHQTLIATKAARICFAAEGDPVLEFGLRRAQGPDAGILGARAAIIGGCAATSNVLAGKMFGVPVRGTHAHSWIMSFDDELTAFREYARLYPSACILLVDTYNTLKSGVPNAIKVFEEMRDSGRLTGAYGIRLDSGDLAYLSKSARVMLDEAGFGKAIISASSDLDEGLIKDLKHQGAKITLWGVGTNLITSKDCPSLGGVYKISAKEGSGGEMVPKIKLSENPEKITNPGMKTMFRIYDKESGKMKADVIALEGETIDATKDLMLFHPIATWKKMELAAGTFTVRELLVPVFAGGKCVYTSPSVMEIKSYCRKELDTLWEEHKRLLRPHLMPVDLSEKLFELKTRLISEMRGI
ncbi:MAG: nicotinate phosphoribosyltransferase [Defluviitaleaceae bacterium]|nr:nicotinate phosphoribosyltransferase [Defluviitaleaceae bacterium]